MGDTLCCVGAFQFQPPVSSKTRTRTKPSRSIALDEFHPITVRRQNSNIIEIGTIKPITTTTFLYMSPPRQEANNNKKKKKKKNQEAATDESDSSDLSSSDLSSSSSSSSSSSYA